MHKNGAPRAERRGRTRRVWPERAFFSLLVLSGIVVTLVPVGETFVNNAQGAGPTRDYVAAIEAAPRDDLAAALAKAEDYNAALTPEALTDPWEERGTVGTTDHDDYLTQLADQEVLGRLRIPQIKVDLPIRHDAGRHELSLGIGHMYGSSLPVGGPGTNAVLAGHTGSRARVFLDRLTEVGMGETFHVDVYGRTLTYRVTKISVVTPDDLAAVARIAGQDLVTLVTCTPDKRRLLVVGTRVPDTDTGASATADGGLVTTVAAATPVTFDDSLQGWMVPRIALAGGGVLLIGAVSATWIAGDRRRRSAERTVLPSTAPGAPPRRGGAAQDDSEEALV